MFLTLLVRRLRDGKSYEHFVSAWYPDKGFGFGGRGPMTDETVEDGRPEFG